MIARARCGPFYWNFMTTDFMSWHANKPLFAYRVKEVHLVEAKIYVDTRKQYLLICMLLYAGMHVFRTSVIPLLMERIRRENNLLIIYIKYDNKSFHGWLNVI